MRFIKFVNGHDISMSLYNISGIQAYDLQVKIQESKTIDQIMEYLNENTKYNWVLTKVCDEYHIISTDSLGNRDILVIKDDQENYLDLSKYTKSELKRLKVLINDELLKRK